MQKALPGWLFGLSRWRVVSLSAYSGECPNKTDTSQINWNFSVLLVFEVRFHGIGGVLDV